jgi:pimeloyl-ACP methyl ester carboxylesterase
VAAETGTLPSGHPFARLEHGARVVLIIPGLTFTADPPSQRDLDQDLPGWPEAAAEHGLDVWRIGRRGDLPAGSTVQDIADDYAAVLRSTFAGPIGVYGSGTGGAYAMWLAIRHPDLVARLALGFTGHKLHPDTARAQRRFAVLAGQGRWRSAYGAVGPLYNPRHQRLGSAAFWMLGKTLVGHPEDPVVLQLDVAAEEGHDAMPKLAVIQCPTLVVSGGRDGAYPPGVVRDLLEGLPHAEHIQYAKAGHFGPGALVARDVATFLARGD